MTRAINLTKFYKYMIKAANVAHESISGEDLRRTKAALKKFVDYHMNTIFKPNVETMLREQNLSPDAIINMPITSFAMSFVKTVEAAGLQNTEDKITVESINESIERSPNRMFHLFIVNKIKLTKLWIACKNQASFAAALDHAYFAGQQFLESLGEELCAKIPNVNVSYSSFDTAFEGKTEIIRYIIRDGIEHNERVVSDKMEVKKTSDAVLNIFKKNMIAGGVKDDNDLDPTNIMMNPSIRESLKNTKEDVDKFVKTGKFKRDHLTDITSSALKIFKDSPELGDNTHFKIAMNTFVTQLDNKVAGAKLDRHSQRIIKEFKEQYYDPSLPIDPKFMSVLNDSDRKMKAMARLQKKKNKLLNNQYK